MAIRDEFLETLIESPPEDWTRGHVTIQLFGPDECIAVEAWRHGAFAVHHLTSGARLTHAPTGLQIRSFANMDDAAEAAEAIEPLTDWNAISKMLPSGTELYPKVREVLDKFEDPPDALLGR